MTGTAELETGGARAVTAAGGPSARNFAILVSAFAIKTLVKRRNCKLTKSKEKNHMKALEPGRTKRNSKRILTALAMGLLLAALPSQAAPGDLLAKVNLPVTGFGVSVGVDCDGNIYYTQGNQNLYKMDKNG